MQRQGRRLAGLVCAAVLAGCAWRDVSTSSVQQSIDMSGPTNFVWNGMTGSYPFGNVSGKSAVALAFTPSGPTDDYYVDSYTGEQCNEFALSATSGPFDGGGSAQVFYAASAQVDYDFTATFTPTQGGSADCTYTIAYTNAGTPGNIVGSDVIDFADPALGGNGSMFLELTGSGSNPDPDLTANPNPLALNVSAGGSGSGSVTVLNIGGGSAAFTPIITSDPVHFSVSPNTPQDLGSGQQEGLTVTCTDNGGSSSYSGTLALDPAVGTGSSVMLMCSVQPNSGITVSPLTLTYPMTLIGTTASPQDVMVTGGGSGNVTLALDGSAAANNVTASPSGTISVPQTIEVAWAPTVAVDGSIGRVQVTYQGVTTNVQLNGTAGSADVETVPQTVDFGAVCAGSGSAMKTLDIFNAGFADIALDNATVSPSPFDVGWNSTAGAQNLRSNHGNDYNLPVTISPSAAGTYSGMIDLTLQVGSLNVPVTATAIPPGIAATPSELTFGTVAVNGTSAGRVFELTNCGSGARVIENAGVQGSGTTLNSEFTVISAPSGSALALTASVSYTIAMTPQSAGPKTASFVITLDSGTTISVALTGNAVDVGSGSGSNKDRETFYACSTSGSGGPGGWPIVAALGVCVFAWRRRRG